MRCFQSHSLHPIRPPKTFPKTPISGRGRGALDYCAFYGTKQPALRRAPQGETNHPIPVSKPSFSPNTFETTTSGITSAGTYEVETGYIKLVNDSNGFVVEVPYSWDDDGSINLDLATAYGAHEG